MCLQLRKSLQDFADENEGKVGMLIEDWEAKFKVDNMSIRGECLKMGWRVWLEVIRQPEGFSKYELWVKIK